MGSAAEQKPTAPPPVPPIAFVLDVDGVMTDGTFWYSEAGKVLKRFGPDDSDALALAARSMTIEFVSADHRGFEISRRRIVDDMGFPLFAVSGPDRLAWIDDRHGRHRVAYMGDGIFDAEVLRAVAYGIAPSDADHAAREAADFVTTRPGGRRAVAEACIHILQRYFGYH